MPNGRVATAPSGTKAFDTNTVVSLNASRAFAAKGYRAVARYVPRLTARANDLSTGEIDNIFMGGLAVMPVQHVESAESWTPTDDKGRQYGHGAADHCLAIGIPGGTNVFLDLEGVAIGTPHEQVIRYCNYWHDVVASAGYLPGIYVGWHTILTPDELSRRLKFTRYWGAYNLNGDQMPSGRGLCMKQHEAKAGDKPDGISYEIDVDSISPDKQGGLPVVFAPQEWDV
jgi:hypothetical protein